MSSADTLRFLPIDLDRHAELGIAFSRDAFVCSFGSDERFVTDAGPGFEAYLDETRRELARDAEACVHVWMGDAIIGQVVLRNVVDEDRGVVRLFYLRPSHRGLSLGAELHRYMQRFFRARERLRLRLNVSPTNTRAIAFYKKHGWIDRGPRPGKEHVHAMELDLDRG